MSGRCEENDVDDVDAAADVGQLEAWVEDYAEPFGLVGHGDGSGQSYKTGRCDCEVWCCLFQFCVRDGMVPC